MHLNNVFVSLAQVEGLYFLEHLGSTVEARRFLDDLDRVLGPLPVDGRLHAAVVPAAQLISRDGVLVAERGRGQEHGWPPLLLVARGRHFEVPHTDKR